MNYKIALLCASLLLLGAQVSTPAAAADEHDRGRWSSVRRPDRRPGPPAAAAGTGGVSARP